MTGIMFFLHPNIYACLNLGFDRCETFRNRPENADSDLVDINNCTSRLAGIGGFDFGTDTTHTSTLVAHVAVE